VLFWTTKPRPAWPDTGVFTEYALAFAPPDAMVSVAPDVGCVTSVSVPPPVTGMDLWWLTLAPDGAWRWKGHMAFATVKVGAL
jgi:hypothetical protein